MTGLQRSARWSAQVRKMPSPKQRSHKLRDFRVVSGVFRLLADGTNERALAIAKIERKKVVLIDAAPVSFGRVWF